MNRICILAVAVCVLSLACVAFAQDVGSSGGCQGTGDPWNYVPQPSGMRFTAAGGGNGLPCSASYNYCWAAGGKAVCAHWTQYSWYGPWGYPCGQCYQANGKHQWLH